MSQSVVLSVIIPTCHRNGSLVKCLESLKPQFQEEIEEVSEVIISDDGLKTTARDLVAKTYPDMQWVEGPHRGPAANRNCGAKHAKGDWLIFIDDDCLPGKSWLSSIVSLARTEKYDVIEGRTIAPDREDNPFKYYVENLNGGSYWSCNLAIRREAFSQLGGFDEDFLEAGGEDMEFAHRIRNSLWRTVFSSDVLVIHPSRDLTLRMLFWRTFLIRWILLYHLKIGQGLPLSASKLRVALGVVNDFSIDLLRTTWHLFSKHDPKRWRSQVCDQAWKWITFPVVLPYLIVWELRFRKMLQLRGDTNRS
jgi:GT2 family glycosyltransferase